MTSSILWGMEKKGNVVWGIMVIHTKKYLNNLMWNGWGGEHSRLIGSIEGRWRWKELDFFTLIDTCTGDGDASMALSGGTQNLKPQSETRLINAKASTAAMGPRQIALRGPEVVAAHVLQQSGG